MKRLYKPFGYETCYSRSAGEAQMVFQIGDKVQYQGNKDKRYYGEKGRIIELMYNSATLTTWKVQFDSVYFGTEIIDEKDLKFVHRKPKSHDRCQCGAHAQKGFEDWHSDWCPMYRRRK